MLGVCVVGLSGSLVKKTLVDNPDAGQGDDEGGIGVEMAIRMVAVAYERVEGVVLKRAVAADDDPAKVALGVMLILFAQIFTATQYVSWISIFYSFPNHVMLR